MAFLRKLFRGNQEDEDQMAADALHESGPSANETAADTPVTPPETTPEPDASAEPLGATTPWWSSAGEVASAPPEIDPAPAPTDLNAEPPAPTAPLSTLEVAPAAPPEHETKGSSTVATHSEAEADGTRQLSSEHAPALSAHRSAQGLAAAALRDIGRVRKVNQDSVFALLTTLPRENADLPMGLFIVADGMGGHEGGEIASRMAVRTVVHQVLSQLVLPALDDTMTEALQPLMVSAVQEANRTIWEYAQAINSDMGTTCTAVLMLGHALYIAHVGDTRSYLLEAGGLRLLTTDHSAVGRLIQLGQLDPDEARDHPLRNQLYRTIGQQPQVQVDFVYQQLGSSTHLLICSDGLWGMIEEAQIQQALLHSPWPQDACQELIALANLAGGEDNISAVVVTLPSAERLAP